MSVKTEAQWQAEYDADTLARAEMIKSDPKRLAAASKAAAAKVEKEKKEAAAMAKVAKIATKLKKK